MNSSLKNGIDKKNSQFVTGMGPVTDKIINDIIQKLSADGVKDQLLYRCIDPVTEIINEKIQPYIYVSIGLYIIVIMLLLIIIYLLIVRK
jgi:hypothetical protein